MARRRYLDGLESVRKVFRTLPRESLERITDALNRGAEEIADRARVLVAEDTGDLKATIKRSDRKTGSGTTGIRVRADGKSAVVYVVAGTSRDTAQAAFRSEFGRQPGPDGHPGHAAQPFMFDSYWSARDRVRRRVAREVNRAAREAARRAR